MTKKMNVATATTTNSGKRNNSTNNTTNQMNVENTKFEMAKSESVEYGGQTGESVEVRLNSVAVERITDGEDGYTAKEMAAMSHKKNVYFSSIKLPNGTKMEKKSYKDAPNGSLCTIGTKERNLDYVVDEYEPWNNDDKYIYTESSYVKIDGEWYDIDYKEWYRLFDNESNDGSELDNAVVECMDALDELHGAEWDEEHRSGYSIELNDEIANNLYDARTKVIERGRNLEDLISNEDANYLISNDYGGVAVWLTENNIICKELNKDEYNKIRCYLKPYTSELELMTELGLHNWPTDDGERHIHADIVYGHLDEIYICQR